MANRRRNLVVDKEQGGVMTEQAIGELNGQKVYKDHEGYLYIKDFKRMEHVMTFNGSEVCKEPDDSYWIEMESLLPAKYFRPVTQEEQVKIELRTMNASVSTTEEKGDSSPENVSEEKQHDIIVKLCNENARLTQALADCRGIINEALELMEHVAP